ncbi:MAG: hypothetical protein HND58_09330 [Planctomycetota bacterium]|nr:MAG: hypothetical protein HND58_09330 [Planctomycetota bacterium]
MGAIAPATAGNPESDARLTIRFSLARWQTNAWPWSSVTTTERSRQLVPIDTTEPPGPRILWALTSPDWSGVGAFGSGAANQAETFPASSPTSSVMDPMSLVATVTGESVSRTVSASTIGVLRGSAAAYRWQVPSRQTT